jgi:hypothetical protein
MAADVTADRLDQFFHVVERGATQALNPQLLILIERDLVALPVTELGGARGRVVSHHLGIFERTLVFQVIRNPRGLQAVIADLRFDSGALSHSFHCWVRCSTFRAFRTWAGIRP